MVKMNAAVVREKSGRFDIEQISLEDPRPNEVLVKIRGTGVCHLDMMVRDQHYPVPLPAVFGHEGSGVVEKVGAMVTKVVPGDHVVISYSSCGVCHNCQKGLPAYCSAIYPLNFSGARLDGSSSCCDREGQQISGFYFGQSSFAEYALTYERNVVKIRKDVPLELMGPLGCGIQSGAGAVFNALKPGIGASIAVFGVGSVGLSAILAAKVIGCTTIIAVDLSQSRLKLAQELGATHVIDGGASDAVNEILSVTDDVGVDYSIECTGNAKVVRHAVDCLRVTGVCGIIGGSPLGTEVTLDLNSVMFGRTVRGIVEGESIPDIFIPQLIELWRLGQFPFDKLIKTFPLAQIEDAVHASERGEVIKPVICPEAA